MSTAQAIAKRIANIHALRKLQEQVDPASGLSLSVRRGVLTSRDERDEERRPWIEMELVDHMDAILELAIDAQLQSLKMLKGCAGREIAELNCVVVDANNLLEDRNE